jgi:hypothetical protein
MLIWLNQNYDKFQLLFNPPFVKLHEYSEVTPFLWGSNCNEAPTLAGTIEFGVAVSAFLRSCDPHSWFYFQPDFHRLELENFSNQLPHDAQRRALLQRAMKNRSTAIRNTCSMFRVF